MNTVHGTAVLSIFIMAVLSSCIRLPAPYHFTDEVQLHDGRTLTVKRTTHFNRGGELGLQAVADQYSFDAINPDTGEQLSWKGDRGFAPRVLDFVNGAAYLIIYQDFTYGNLKQYGCPDIPYVFLRYDRSTKTWRQVDPTSVSRDLLTANFSASHYDSGSMTPERRSVRDIALSYSTTTHFNDGKSTRAIPTTFKEWNDKYKNAWRVRHDSDGCRSTVPSTDDPTHVQSSGQPSQRVTIEILYSEIFDPPRIIEGDRQTISDQWTALTYDIDRSNQCMARLKRVDDNSDRPELRGWLIFNEDPTGQNKAQMRGSMYCDEQAFWFSDYAIERGKVVLTKFTRIGSAVYRVSFPTPNVIGGAAGGIIQKSFRNEDGYVYFEWWNTHQSGISHEISATRSMRFREPAAVQR